MTIEEFYTAIRHKGEPETLAHANETSLTYGTRRYLKLFRTKGQKPLFVSRNVSAIFFSPFWFLYRRMYALAFLFTVIWFLIEYGIRHYTNNEIVVDCLELAFAVYVSLFANSFYFNNVRRRHAKGLNSNPTRLVIYLGMVSVMLGIVLMLVMLKMYFIMMQR